MSLRQGQWSGVWVDPEADKDRFVVFQSFIGQRGDAKDLPVAREQSLLERSGAIDRAAIDFRGGPEEICSSGALTSEEK